jgi:hypothetical protein
MGVTVEIEVGGSAIASASVRGHSPVGRGVGGLESLQRPPGGANGNHPGLEKGGPRP